MNLSTDEFESLLITGGPERLSDEEKDDTVKISNDEVENVAIIPKGSEVKLSDEMEITDVNELKEELNEYKELVNEYKEREKDRVINSIIDIRKEKGVLKDNEDEAKERLSEMDKETLEMLKEDAEALEKPERKTESKTSPNENDDKDEEELELEKKKQMVREDLNLTD